MISQSLNDKLTHTGPATPAGAVLRRYWQPAALMDEVERGLPLAVNLLGERLAVIEGKGGHLELVTRSNRDKASGIVYPDAAAIVPDSDGPRYPVVAKNGLLFAYLGPGQPPALPQFDCFRAPDSHSFAFKGLWACNWLQALEIGIDPAHASFLHRFLEDEDPDDGYGKQFRDKAAETNMPMTRILREYPRPDIDVEETDYGLKITALRHLRNDMTHVRVTNQIFPCAICIPMSREMTITQWHVPIDDTHCFWYSMFTSFDQPVNKPVMREQRMREHRLPDYAPIKNKANHYQYNADEQATLTYTGMGMDINVHDQWAVEGMGPIQDRTREHLGRSDVAIIRYRRMLRQAIAAVQTDPLSPNLPMSDAAAAAQLQGPLSNDAVAATRDWAAASHEADLNRRAACSWDASVS